MRLAQIQEVEDRRVLVAPRLQPGVRAGVRRDEGRSRDADQVLRALFVLEQLRPRDAHELDAHAHEADVVDVAGDVRPRPREPDPGAVRASRLGEDPPPHVLGEIVAHREVGADDSVGLRVPAALVVAGFPEPSHLCLECVDDRLEALLLVRPDPLLGDREALVGAPQVDQPGEEPRERLPEQPVHRRPEEGIDAPLDVDYEDPGAADRVEDEVAGVGRRQAVAATPKRRLLLAGPQAGSSSSSSASRRRLFDEDGPRVGAIVCSALPRITFVKRSLKPARNARLP